jgi:prolyl-tRNA editing enzyme YbaK/EbsC (Cys-tRNA(Pro) deacylase)
MTVDFSRFADVLKSLGVTGEVRELPEPAPTAAAAAQQLGCEVGAIANSLVFDADGAPLLVMTSGAHRVDTDRVASLVGASAVGRANARSVRDWTGQAIGGVGPVAHPAPIRTLVDTWLARYDVVWAAAGHPHTVFPTSFDELLRITAGDAADVGDLPSQRLVARESQPVTGTSTGRGRPGSTSPSSVGIPGVSSVPGTVGCSSSKS